MRKVSGYISADGAFHETEEDASYHEAYQDLMKGLAEIEGIHPTQAIAIVVKYIVNFRRFVDAYDAKANRDTTNDKCAEEITSAMEQFSISGHSTMPDMGNSIGTASIQHESAFDGFGSRRDNARGVLGVPNLATGENAKLTEARHDGCE